MLAQLLTVVRLLALNLILVCGWRGSKPPIEFCSLLAKSIEVIHDRGPQQLSAFFGVGLLATNVDNKLNIA